MKKGFLFSVEALLSVTVIIAALVMLNYSFTVAAIDNDVSLIKAQSAQATAFYYNTTALGPDTNTSFCGNVGQYAVATKTINAIQICKGYS